MDDHTVLSIVMEFSLSIGRIAASGLDTWYQNFLADVHYIQNFFSDVIYIIRVKTVCARVIFITL